ncbi:odorant receptor 85f [Cochliomyia hominivorax]
MSTKSFKSLLKQKEFQDFCHLPNLLTSSVSYDFQNSSETILWYILKKCYFVIAGLCHCYIFVFIGRATHSMYISDAFDLGLLLRLISGFNYSFFSSLKSIAFLWKIQEIRSIYEALMNIYPKPRKEKISYEVNEGFWPKWILTIVYFYLGVVAFIATSPLLESIILYLINLVKFGWRRAEFGYYKLYEIEYSFDHRNPLAYIVTYAMEMMHAHFMIMFNICGEIWLLCFTLQLCMHFKYVSKTLENYEPNDQDFQKDQYFIETLIQKHQILLNIGNTLNMVFGYPILLLLISTAGTLVCAGVYVLTQGLGREFIEYVAFLPTAIGQYYVICHYGQQLIIKSQGVGEAAYNHSWYNGSKSYKKSIFIILMRSQKEVELNALGFQPICLEAFKMVMGNTYRVFTLFKETML